MRRFGLLAVVTLLLTLILVGASADKVYSQQFQVTLTPTSGFSAINVTGIGFYGHVHIHWDYSHTPLPTVPTEIYGYNGTRQWGVEPEFTAIISVPTQAEPGEHIVTVVDEEGNEADATFTVIDITGPQGSQGLQGQAGATGLAGAAGAAGTAGEQGPTGEQGLPGEQGPPGETGSQGEAGPGGGIGIIALILALIALGFAVFGKIKQWIFG